MDHRVQFFVLLYTEFKTVTIGVGAQSTLGAGGGKTFEKKNNKIPEFL